jgi:hypothetical protein
VEHDDLPGLPERRLGDLPPEPEELRDLLRQLQHRVLRRLGLHLISAAPDQRSGTIAQLRA